MKEIMYDKELMDQYIERTYSESDKALVTEEERQWIADTLAFQSYCLNHHWKEFKRAVLDCIESPLLKLKEIWRGKNE